MDLGRRTRHGRAGRRRTPRVGRPLASFPVVLLTMGSLVGGAAAAAAVPADAVRAARPVRVASPVRMLDGFTYELSVSIAAQASGVVTSRGTYVAPGRATCSTRVVAGTHVAEERVVAVGRRFWIDRSSSLRAARREDATLLDFCAAEAAFWAPFARLDLPARVGAPARINGIRARRHRLDGSLRDEVVGVLGNLPAGVDVLEADVWLAEAGQWLLAFRIVLSTVAPACGGLEHLDPPVFVGPCILSAKLELARANDQELRVSSPRRGQSAGG